MHYEIREFAGYPCIIILNGKPEIWQTVIDIGIQAEVNPENYLIVFSDTTTGLWDAYNAIKKKVVILNSDNQWHAIRRYIKHHL